MWNKMAPHDLPVHKVVKYKLKILQHFLGTGPYRAQRDIYNQVESNDKTFLRK